MALSSLMRQSCLRAASRRALYTCFYVLDIRFLTRHFLSAGVKGYWVSMRRVGPFHMGVIYYGTRLRRINLILKAMKGWSDQINWQLQLEPSFLERDFSLRTPFFFRTALTDY